MGKPSLMSTSLQEAKASIRQDKGRMPSREKRAILYALSLFLDCASLAAGYSIALAFRSSEWLVTDGLPILALAMPVFIMFEIARETQSVESLESRSLALQRSLGALVSCALVVLALSFFLDQDDLSRVGYFVMFAAAAGFIILAKLVENLLFKYWMGGSATSTLVLHDGLEVPVIEKADHLNSAKAGLTPDLDRPETMDAVSHLMAPYDRVVVACSFDRRALWATLLKSQDVGGEVLMDRDILHGAVAIGNYAGEDTLVMSRGPLSLINRLQKRAFDLTLASIGVIAISPILLVVSVLIKLEDGGPLFFMQNRVGRGSRQFRIYKFRSMSVQDTDHDGAKSAAKDDDRVTRVGRFIRRTSIDELPQLFNVIAGDMSLVGPRPHALGSLAGDDLFWRVDDQYWIRHALKPGLTGLAQVRGHRGATDTLEDLRLRVRSDLEYLTNWSLGLDFLILFQTVRVLVHPKAY